MLELSEKVGYRLRKYKLKAFTINIQIKTNEFITYSHQKKLSIPTSSTKEIYRGVKNDASVQVGIQPGTLMVQAGPFPGTNTMPGQGFAKIN